MKQKATRTISNGDGKERNHHSSLSTRNEIIVGRSDSVGGSQMTCTLCHIQTQTFLSIEHKTEEDFHDRSQFRDGIISECQSKRACVTFVVSHLLSTYDDSNKRIRICHECLTHLADALCVHFLSFFSFSLIFIYLF